MLKKNRPLNDFVHCSCGVTYISGYTHCPKCGTTNIAALQDKEEVSNHIAEEFDKILEEVADTTTNPNF